MATKKLKDRAAGIVLRVAGAGYAIKRVVGRRQAIIREYPPLEN
jgi:hypothetical protein